MPLLAWNLPAGEAAANDRVVTMPGADASHVNMGYSRLSPFSARARATIREIYQDLARHTPFDGLLFHDDATLSDYEDASPSALAAYRALGLPGSLQEIRASDDLLGRWTILKINAIDDFANELADVVREEQPQLRTVRNLYARVALSPKAEVWYSQALENSLRNYDYTAIMAMPYMEQAPDVDAFYRDLAEKVKEWPDGFAKVVFELQTVDWRKDNRLLPTAEIVATIKRLYEMGARNIAYYPDMMFENHPDPAMMRAIFATMPDTVPLK
jgi:biofilm PGA synthesis lipoprotein PgaB